MRYTTDLRKLTKKQRLKLHEMILKAGYTADYETTRMLVKNTSSMWHYIVLEKSNTGNHFISYSVLPDSTIELSFEDYIKLFNNLKCSRDFKYYAVKCNNINEMNFVFEKLGYHKINVFHKYAITNDGCSNVEFDDYETIAIKDWLIKINENYEI